MLAIGIIMLSFMFLIAVIGAGLRLAWGVTKFIFGLGLFWICPLLFVLVVLFGGFSYMWLPIVVVGLLCGRGYRRI